MSYESWCKEFYPSPPSEDMTPLKAAKHSLRKWKGVLPANLRRHGLTRDRDMIREDYLVVHTLGALSCALCVINDVECQKCSIMLAGHKGCTHEGSAYIQALEKNRITSMIRVLESAVLFEQRRRRPLKIKE
jgi:hypothetical protein